MFSYEVVEVEAEEFSDCVFSAGLRQLLLGGVGRHHQAFLDTLNIAVFYPKLEL